MNADTARAHVAAVVDRVPEMRDADVDTWVAAVLAHVEPLPLDRPWRIRRWIPASARRHTAVLERDQQHQDQPDPGVLVAHMDAHQRYAAGKAAFQHLHELGLVSAVVVDTLVEEDAA